MSNVVVQPRKPNIVKALFAMLKFRSGNYEQILSLIQAAPKIFTYHLAYLNVHYVSKPDEIEEIMVKKHKHFHKDPGTVFIKMLVGEGLLTTEELVHLRQRRMIQPAFHKEKIDAYANVMIHYAMAMREEWKDGDCLDIHTEMMKVTLAVIGKTMFSSEVEDESEKVAYALDTFFNNLDLLVIPGLGKFVFRMPFGPGATTRKAIEDVDEAIYRMIEEHKNEDHPPNDLMLMLLAAQDDDGSTMTMTQVRDECMTLFLAGHETTANALTWTWMLLSENPEAEAKLHEELDRVLGDRPPTPEDYMKLHYTKNVISESLRLYPPAFALGRTAISNCEIGGKKIRKRDIVNFSPMFTQRDPELWGNPDAFDPDRWDTEEVKNRHKFSYFPFGGGSRKCIGEPFAWMEAVLLLATFAQKWQLKHDPTHKIQLDPKITLRPKYGMRMYIHERN